MSDRGHGVVAIVDDDPAVRDSLRLLLELEGCAVQAFADAPSFLASGMRQFACLVLDHHMPGITGLDMLDRMRKAGIAMPTMLITGAPSAAIAARAVALGVDHILTKPPDEAALLAFVNAACG
jgi:two-component system, LuxR family, response regulator FixJ